MRSESGIVKDPHWPRSVQENVISLSPIGRIRPLPLVRCQKSETNGPPITRITQMKSAPSVYICFIVFGTGVTPRGFASCAVAG